MRSDIIFHKSTPRCGNLKNWTFAKLVRNIFRVHISWFWCFARATDFFTAIFDLTWIWDRLVWMLSYILIGKTLPGSGYSQHLTLWLRITTNSILMSFFLPKMFFFVFYKSINGLMRMRGLYLFQKFLQVCNPPKICQAHSHYPPYRTVALEKPLV